MSISSSAVLVALNISVWPAAKLDKEVTDRVTADAAAHRNAGKFKKDLFAGTSLRKDIERFAAKCRQYHATYTLPWADKGDRLLPTSLLVDYKQAINGMRKEFDGRCHKFFTEYPQLCAAAPTNMGRLYKAEDYPSLEEVGGKFGFRFAMSPIPEAGDFRLDVGNEDLADIKEQYARDMDARLADAMRDPWERLHKSLTSISEKLTDEPNADDDAPKKRYHETLVTSTKDLCKLLDKLNITRDPKLDDARRQLEATMHGADIEVLRDNPQVRESMKSKVDAILGKFEW